MKKMLLYIVIGTLLFGCTLGSDNKESFEAKEPLSLSYEDQDFRERYEKTKPSEKALESLWTFAAKSFETLREENNSFYSPTSLYIALSMLKEGAEGDSLKELSELMGEPMDAKAMIEHIALNKDSGKLLLANSFWVHKDSPILESYRDSLINDYYASAFKRDLHTKETMDEIAGWIYKKTEEKIKPELRVSDKALLYLVNTLYLESPWKDSFDKNNTTTGDFNPPSGGKADYMQQEAMGLYLEKEENKLATRNLAEGISIYFVLPKEGHQLKDITYDKVFQSLDKGEFVSIKWRVPKVELNWDGDLIEPLQKLGVKEIFTPNANLSKISSSPLFVSLIRQWTNLEMDEVGIKAAAATIIGIEESAMEPEKVVEMDLNRPFGLIIVRSGFPLFIGEVYHPYGYEK